MQMRTNCIKVKPLAPASHLAKIAFMSEIVRKPTPMENALRDEGVRLTRQRRVLLQVLADADDHPDANELHRRAHSIDPKVSLATVYRTLSVLEGAGVIDRHAFEGKPARFETADRPHHDHLIDLETGDVVEFRSEKIERLQAEIAAELGYDIVHHRLELYGRRKR